jgi:hypothetical protein
VGRAEVAILDADRDNDCRTAQHPLQNSLADLGVDTDHRIADRDLDHRTHVAVARCVLGTRHRCRASRSLGQRLTAPAEPLRRRNAHLPRDRRHVRSGDESCGNRLLFERVWPAATQRRSNPITRLDNDIYIHPVDGQI